MKRITLAVLFALLAPSSAWSMKARRTQALMNQHRVSAEQCSALFMQACQKGNLNTVEALISFVSSECIAMALSLAVQNKDERLVILLLAQSNIHPDNCYTSFTPLRQAIQNGAFNIVKVLVAAKADMEKPDPEDVSPLHAASTYGHADIVQFFIEQGAKKNDNVKNKKRLNPPSPGMCWWS